MRVTVQVAAGASVVVQVVVAGKSGDYWMETIWSVVVPVLVRVTVWVVEALPMVVLAKVSAPWESW